MSSVYLSRLVLNLRNWAARRDLADCCHMHRTVMAAFPSLPRQRDARAELGALFRVDVSRASGATIVLVQSAVEPDWSHLPHGYLEPNPPSGASLSCKPLDGALAAVEDGDVLRFRLRANPSRKIDTKTGSDGRRRNGKRVELRGDDERLDWLRRKGQQGGFEPVSVRTDPGALDVRSIQERRARSAVGSQGDGITIAAVLFEGHLRVTDRDAFLRMMARGIGPGKAYGFGLLSIARAGTDA